MSQVDELLNQLANSPVKTAGAGAAEEHIIIDRDRYITVPDSLKKIGVQFDHNIETITFDCPRYWDDIDMSEMKIYVNYMRSDEHMGMYLCENVVVEDDIMHFDWTISKDVTFVEGYISFLVCIKKTDEEGNEENHWNSELNSDLYVSKGLNCQGSVIHKHPDIITQLLTRMENVEVEQQDWVNDQEAALEKWKESQETSYSNWTSENERYMSSFRSTMEQSQSDWQKTTYANLDDRMKTAEGNTTPEEILNRVHEALETDETTQQTIIDKVDTYVEENAIGEKLYRVVLWSNDEVASFPAQTITLNDDLSNYDSYEILYRYDIDHATTRERVISSGIIPVDKRATGQLSFECNYIRSVAKPTGGNKIEIDDCKRFTSYGSLDTETANNKLVPYRVFGYGKGYVALIDGNEVEY